MQMPDASDKSYLKFLITFSHFVYFFNHFINIRVSIIIPDEFA